jgi:hypothetical protein
MSVDPYYKKMMFWVAVALIASVVTAFIVVEFVVRHYGP